MTLYSIILFCIMLCCCAVLCCAAMNDIVQSHTLLHHAVLHGLGRTLRPSMICDDANPTTLQFADKPLTESPRFPNEAYPAAGNPVPVFPGMAHGEALVASVHHLPQLPQPAPLLCPAVPVLQQACHAPLPAFAASSQCTCLCPVKGGSQDYPNSSATLPTLPRLLECQALQLSV